MADTGQHAYAESPTGDSPDPSPALQARAAGGLDLFLESWNSRRADDASEGQ